MCFPIIDATFIMRRSRQILRGAIAFQCEEDEVILCGEIFATLTAPRIAADLGTFISTPDRAACKFIRPASAMSVEDGPTAHCMRSVPGAHTQV
jgi:hypothetical protein